MDIGKNLAHAIISLFGTQGILVLNTLIQIHEIVFGDLAPQLLAILQVNIPPFNGFAWQYNYIRRFQCLQLVL